MRKLIRRYSLMLLSMLPIAAVAFAAKSALSVDQLGQKGVSLHDLAHGGSDSKGN